MRAMTVRWGGAALWCVQLAACAGAAPAERQDDDTLPAWAATYDPAVRADLARVRVATEPFRDLAAAQAAGYPTNTPPCLDNAEHGGMGHHYVNRALLDDSLAVERPEILLYAPVPDGAPQLVAVEYIIPYRIRSRDATPPRIFGEELKRSDELSLWYLHVWAWEQNRAGLFADWNTAVKCF